MRKRRRGWTGAMSAARIHGCPDVVATMWIVLMLFGTLGGVLCYPPWGAAPVPPEPVQVMTDVTNHLGVSLLQDFAYQPGNVAFSPYGAASVLIVLWEGARGESGGQLRRALGLPSSSHPTLDHGVIRLGMRDIHRHLRSYFAHDGYLNGLTFGNTTEANIKPSFRHVLRFYGYDPDTAMTGGGSGGEMATPPWMKKPLVTTTPLPGVNETSATTNATDSVTESKTEKPTKANETSPATTKKPVTILPTVPPTTPPKLTASTPTTAKPTKTTKSLKTTTPKPSTSSTSKTTTKPTSKPAQATTAKPPPTKAPPKPPPPRPTSPQSTLQDFNAPPIAAFSDVTDSTSSTRVTRKMMSGEPDDAGTPTLSVSIPTQSSEQVSGMRTSLMPTMFSPMDYDDVESSEAESSSTLASMNREKTTTSGITTTFVLMMTTKKVQQLITDATPITNLPIIDGTPQIPQSTSPISATSTTPMPPQLGKFTESDEISRTNDTVMTERPSISSTEAMDLAEATTQVPIPDEVTKEPLPLDDTSGDDDSLISTTTPEYETTTSPSEAMAEMSTTMSSDSDPMLPTPETLMGNDATTTESSDIEMMMTTTEAMGVTEETTTQAPDNAEVPGAEEAPKSRRRRSENGEDHYPEIQLHLHGNAMLSKDEQDLDKLWQNYQGQFGLPLAPFHVHQGQGFESGIKWVPMIRLVRLLPFAYSSRLQAQALMLPLDDERYKLLLILPVGETNGGNGGWRPSRRKRSYPFHHQNDHQDGLLLRLIDDLRSVPLREIVSSVQPCLVAATIPPFLIRGLLDLTPSLQRIGVKDVFDVKTADLSGMSNDTNMWVRGVEQTVSVAIDVNGLFGGEGTGYRSKPEEHGPQRDQQDWSQQQENPNNHQNHNKRNAPRYWGGPTEEPRVQGHFMATRPFLFFVVDTSTRVALMAGKVTDPLSTKNA